MEAAALAKERQDMLFATRSASISANAPSRVECLKALIEGHGTSGVVEEGESVQNALARWGKARKVEVEEEKERSKLERRKNKSSSASKLKKDFDAPDEESPRHPASTTSKESVESHDMDLDPLMTPQPSYSNVTNTNNSKGKQKGQQEPPLYETSALKQAIDTLTTLASTLLGTYGETGIYEETYEGIMKQLIAEGEVPRDWRPSQKKTETASNDIEVAKNGHSRLDDLTEVKHERKSIVSRPVIARPKS